jgi:hypothetical protein
VGDLHEVYADGVQDYSTSTIGTGHNANTESGAEYLHESDYTDERWKEYQILDILAFETFSRWTETST